MLISTMVPVMFYPNVLLKRPSTRLNGESGMDEWIDSSNEMTLMYSARTCLALYPPKDDTTGFLPLFLLYQISH